MQTKGLTSEDVTNLTEEVRTLMETEFHKITKEVEDEARVKGSSLLLNKNE
jgi:hypothetical protein